ncbi:biotin transporter BioY [Oceanobacillus profundus]|uniref:Biotin transporter n=1 Tax=Oceanobacillus profundus TaxID=372463 RepID=A0A417YMG4_9BACI|nr:biotin transporter BioY [Oceanobacillus profundus]MCM3400205.1 biotin transporter BioY [Oceanobacillus profundus]PAE29729.1 BioY family transporter [Paenibacillus sp. 7884-2]RHW34562.1 biotin transporter BioY [Oceanobacillus profundus]
MRLRPIDLTFGAMFVCLMAIGANITVWFPFLAIPIGGATVPVSLQTFFAILAGMMLGRKLGSISMVVYAFLGAAGLPIFAGLKGGFFQFISPTGGFILSFILIAFFVGWMTENRKARSIPYFIFVAIIGLAINYGVGTTYMYLAMNTWLDLSISYPIAWAGMIPFMIKDAILSIVAALFMLSLAKRIPSTLRNVNIQ